MKKIILCAVILIIFTTSCGKKTAPRTERVFDIDVNMENDFLNIESTKKSFNAHGGDFYSGVDSINIYGAGYSKKIVDSLKGYNLDVVISAWIREMKLPDEGGIAVSVNAPNVTKDWQVVKCKAGSFKVGEWNQIKDTLKFTADKMKDVTEVKIFSMKSNGSDLFDVDDLRIKYIFHK